MKKALLLLIVLFSFNLTYAQDTFPVNGISNKNHNYYAFTNAVIHTDYKTEIDNAVLLIKDGKIIDAGKNIKIPKGTVVYDLKGKHIYPSLIDIYSNYGEPKIKKENKKYNHPQMERKTDGAFGWNEAVKPETDASKLFKADQKEAKKLRELGFGAVLTSPMDGIVRGSAVFASLGDDKENELIIKGDAAALFSFSKGSSTQDYPSSLMGAIALIRQTYYDADWYKNLKNKEEYNISLEAFNKLLTLPQIFEVNNKLSVLRADKIGDEFGIQYIIKGAGDEYQRLDDIKGTNAKFIIPLDFPKAYDVSDPYDANLVSLSKLKHWELAPANPAYLEKKGVDFAITSADLKDKKAFWKNLREAIEYGLSEETALKALTYNPAQMLGMDNQIGSLKKGMIANFLITSKDLFDKKNIIFENWIQGKPYSINDYNLLDVRGNYDLTVDGKSYNLIISGDLEKPSAKIETNDTSKISAKLDFTRKLVSLSFSPEGDEGSILLTGDVSENPTSMKGKGQLTDGTWITWKAAYKSAAEEKEMTNEKEEKELKLGKVIYPFTAYGKKDFDNTNDVLIKNATVWTNEKEGILKNTDVFIKNGKIAKIGKNLDASGIRVIDGTGKHLTSGVIDEHSHIAISGGVNESAQASSAEVKIGDVINPEDINIYRQLSGGVTAIQQLHGSANPIGGQSSIIKLRWGKSPEEMKIKNASPFIKFALGENVKQSNWGDYFTVRYPQTRMGVEQFYYEMFTRAREYEKKWSEYNKLSSNEKAKVNTPRRDLDLETLVQILNSERFITCHSYVQSEVNMLMHVADSMGFRLNTFTHILEGYKVADKMKAHGAGGSTFSDWWAYKMEVVDAVPYNAAIMDKMGVVTAVNSDDPEMARRLNQEAAKSIKYGGISEEEALKLVTLNPAKLLHLDNRMGSIKVGKDGDVVLWSDNPLSVYAKAEKTIIDGIVYFDREKDLELRDWIQKERARIIQKMISEKKEEKKTQKPMKDNKIEYRCETVLSNYMTEEL